MHFRGKRQYLYPIVYLYCDFRTSFKADSGMDGSGHVSMQFTSTTGFLKKILNFHLKQILNASFSGILKDKTMDDKLLYIISNKKTNPSLD